MKRRMTPKYPLIALILALSGCSMSSQDVVRQVKDCEDVGMKGVPMAGLFHGRIMEVQCWPRDDMEKEVKPSPRKPGQ